MSRASVKNITPENLAKAEELYAQGMPMVEIIKIVGISRDYLKINFKSRGIRIRPRSDNLVAWKKANPNHQDKENNPNWKGGSRSTVYRDARAALLAVGRNQHICEKCGKVNLDERHNIHHIDEDRSNNAPENLQVLCVVCHNSGSPNAEHVRLRGENGRFVCQG